MKQHELLIRQVVMNLFNTLLSGLKSSTLKIKVSGDNKHDSKLYIELKNMNPGNIISEKKSVRIAKLCEE